MKPMHITLIVLGGLMVVMAICPWAVVSGSSSYAGQTLFQMSINVSGIYMFSGWLGILGAIAGIVLPIIQATRKFAIIPAGVCILAAIVGFIQAASYGGTSSSYGGATASGGVSIGWGLIVFAVFAVAYLVISIITFQDKSQNPE